MAALAQEASVHAHHAHDDGAGVGVTPASDDREPAASSHEVRTWTNRDVLLWLLKVDQKSFVPAFLKNNVTGPLLLQLDSPSTSSNKKRWTLADLAGDATAEQLAGLEGLLAQLLEPERQLTSDEDHGWSYTKDYNMAVEVVISGLETIRCRCILQRLKHQKEFISLWTLLISTLTTLVSVVGAALGGDGADPCEEGEEAGGDWVTAFAFSLTTTLLAASLTLLAGYSKIYDFDNRVRTMEAYVNSEPDLWTGCLEQLMEPIAKRDSFKTLKARAEERKSTQLDRPYISPAMWESSLGTLHKTNPEQWRADFAPFYDIYYPCCKASTEYATSTGNRSIPFWARWLGLVEFRPIWNETATLTKALDKMYLGSLEKNWPEEFEASAGYRATARFRRASSMDESSLTGREPRIAPAP